MKKTILYSLVIIFSLTFTVIPSSAEAINPEMKKNRTERFKKHFVKADKNNDKVLSEEEFVAYSTSKLGKNWKKKRNSRKEKPFRSERKRFKGFFKKLDLNKDQKISEQEQIQHCKKRFLENDIDNDGYITPQETKTAKEKKRKKHHKRRDRNLERNN